MIHRISQTGAGRSARGRLMAGVACALLAAPGLALAQDTPPTPDGLGDEGLYLEADTVTRSGEDVITASGIGERVLARFQGRTLRGQEVTYDLGLGTAAASGRVELVNPDGTLIFADLLELDEDLNTGVAVDVAVLSPTGEKLMAATAVRRSETVNELNYALFTPCPICDDEGNPKEPSWSIQAQQVVQDQSLRAVLYRNAVFRVAGVPVFYLPYFAHPDPTIERASGFLSPRIDYTDARGLSFEQPYLWVVSPSEDVLISPQFNTRVAPMLNLQWRRMFETGIIEARAGYTYERNFGDFDVDGDGDVDSDVRFGPREHRGYLLAYGAFDPDGPWRWGFTAERVSDKTLFDRYDTVSPYQDNGLYFADRRRLISQAYAERQTRRSYLSVAAFTIQTLRIQEQNLAVPALSVFEEDGIIPIVAPLIDARYEPEGEVFGGRLRLRGSAVALTREDYVGAPVLRPETLPAFLPRPAPSDPRLPGVDSRRITAEVDWRRVLTAPAGIRYEPFVSVRGDAYSIDDLPGDEGAEIGRGRAAAGVDVSYPLIRRFDDGSDLVLEPMAQLAGILASDLDPRIPNEDSQVVDLDEATLFRTDRFTGLDLYEQGVRLTLGGRATYRWGDGRSATAFVGRSFRDADEPDFLVEAPDAPGVLYDPTGLADQASHWVVAATFSPTERFRGWAHAQVDDGGSIVRAEAAVDAGWGERNLASVQYILDRTNPISGPLNRNYEFIQVEGQQFVAGDWGLSGRAIGDLETDTLTRAEIALLYEDDCLRFEIGYRRDNTRVDPSGPRTGLFARLTLATFGGSGYEDEDTR